MDAALMSRDAKWIPFLIRGLGSRNAEVQHAAKRALPVFGEAAMIGLLRAAAHGRGTVREEAVACLGEWGDVRALQPLLLALQNDRRERNARLSFRFIVAVIGSLLARYPQEAEALWAQVKSETRLRVQACAALGRLGDVRAVVPLVEMARSHDPEVAFAAKHALGHLLTIVAVLPSDQTRLLGPEGIPGLLTLLDDPDEPLVRLTLTALRTVGDKRAMPRVARLAAEDLRPFIRQEASALLALLQARMMQEQERATLLRQSHAPQARTPDVLLRPAPSISPSYPNQLLRGSIGDNSGDKQ